MKNEHLIPLNNLNDYSLLSSSVGRILLSLHTKFLWFQRTLQFMCGYSLDPSSKRAVVGFVLAGQVGFFSNLLQDIISCILYLRFTRWTFFQFRLASVAQRMTRNALENWWYHIILADGAFKYLT